MSMSLKQLRPDGPIFLHKKRHSKRTFALFSDKSTQTKADTRKRSNVWEDPSLPVKIPKTVVSPETVKSAIKLDLPGQQQMSVTFIPNQGSTPSTVDHQGTVDVSHLQGVLSNFMTNNTSGTLPTEVEEAVAGLNNGAVEPALGSGGDIVQSAVDSLNLADIEDSALQEKGNEEADGEDEDEDETPDKGPTSAKSENVQVDGLLYDGMQFLHTYTQENCTRWSCAEKGCRASINTTPLPNKYTVESLVTPTVLCATPHDISIHREGIHKVKEEDMRKVNGFVGIGKSCNCEHYIPLTFDRRPMAT